MIFIEESDAYEANTVLPYKDASDLITAYSVVNQKY